MPSAEPVAGVHALHGWARLTHTIGRFIIWSCGIVAVVLLAAGTYLYAYGIQNPQLTSMAQRAVQSIAGPGLNTELKDARLSLDSGGNLAFEARDLTVKRTDGSTIASSDRVLLGLKLFSLVGGQVEISDLEITRLALAGSGKSLILPVAILDDKGRIEPGKLAMALNTTVSGLHKALDERKLESISVSDLTLGSQSTSVPRLTATISNDGHYDLEGEAIFADQPVAIGGFIGRDGYEVKLDGIQFGEQTDYAPELNFGESIQLVPFHGQADVKITGVRTAQLPGSIRISASIANFDFQNFRRVRLSGSADFAADIREGSNKIEILPSTILAGKNQIVFTGAAGPDSDNISDAYRFELVSNDLDLMPSESSDEPTSAALRLAGTYSPSSRAIDLSQIGIRTEGGELTGRGSVVLGDKSPEIILALSIAKMRVADAKHLWPAIFASGARRWVLAHVFGGRLIDSRINISFAHGDLWPRDDPRKFFLPNPQQVSARFGVEGARFDVLGDLPPVRDSVATIDVAGADTVISLSSGTAFLESGTTVSVKGGTMAIPVVPDQPTIAELDVIVEGDVAAIADIANREPLNALAKAPVAPEDLSGSAVAQIKAKFPLRRTDTNVAKSWSAKVDFKGLTIAKEFSGQKLSDAVGTLEADTKQAVFVAKGKLNGVPASVSLTEPFGPDGGKRTASAKLELDDAARATLAPGLSEILNGPISLSLVGSADGGQLFEAELDRATLSLPWAGWSKGKGVAAKASFSISSNEGTTRIQNLQVKGASFSLAGDVTLQQKSLSRAVFKRVSLNKGDDFQVAIEREKKGYAVDVSGNSIDLRALLKRISNSFDEAAQATGGVPITLKARLGSVTGFNGEQLKNAIASYYGVGSEIKSFAASATSAAGGNVALDNSVVDGGRRVTIQTSDGGALLRFMDIYDKMQGGTVSVNLGASGKTGLVGEIDARNFVVAGEPRLKALVGAPVGPDGQPLESAKSKIDVSRVRFERGNAQIEKGKGNLKLSDGILRSDQFGLSYAGTLYDANGRINMNGTFLPIYGLNRIFGELPIFGEILGNDRDNALLGITFKLQGAAKSPVLSVNPISIIAPGIFRKIFEFQ